MLINRHLDGLKVFHIMNSSHLNIFVDLPLRSCDYFCSVIPEREIAGSEFWYLLPNGFPNNGSNLYSLQNYMRVYLLPHLIQFRVLFFFF